jgi:hypothetical protein
MRKTIGYLQLCSLVLACLGSVGAQEKREMSPPKVLTITREWVKPGKSGPPHVKTESAFVSAMAAAKWPQHYFAMDSLTGPPRSLFFEGYDSFEAWEKDNQATEKNASLSAALSKAAVADGELLTGIETTAFAYREDLSYQANIDVAKMRYFDISRYKVRTGHGKDWEAIVKMFKDGYAKAVPDAHWAVFEDIYGKEGAGIFIVITPLKSLAEVDKSFGDSKKFTETMGDDGMKKLDEMMAASTEFLEANLFSFNPAESYAPPEWVKSDPDFWKSKAPAATEKKPAKKPTP